jgi:hypothetical protein
LGACITVSRENSILVKIGQKGWIHYIKTICIDGDMFSSTMQKVGLCYVAVTTISIFISNFAVKVVEAKWLE